MYIELMLQGGTMRRISAISLSVLMFSVLLSGQQKAAPAIAAKDKSKPVAAAVLPVKSTAESAAARLPVRRVVLYKNGVGYFEHTGRVNGSQQVGIDFTTAQLNDALKSLTVVDLGGGRITGVNYNSVAPLEQRLKTLRLPLTASTSREEYLNALRGAKVEVKNGATIATGRVLSIDLREHKKDDKSIEQRYELSLVTETNDLRTFELSPSTSVRLMERDLNTEVSRYMDLIASTRAEDLRRMTVSTSGNGERTLFVSYISEVPVWKSTYRIILPEKATDKPRLQGWAIVDNTVGEDWTNVELSLVAGAPQSFVENLSQPLYIRRPEVALPTTAQLTPQSHEGTVDNDEATEGKSATTSSSYGVAGHIGVGSGSGVAGGYLGENGIVTMRRGVVGGAPASAPQPTVPASATTVEVVSAEVEPVATSQELGDLFEYKLKDRVTIAKNQSALVPILSSNVEVEKVTMWHEDAKYPLRALWMTNSSGETLDAGTFNIVDAGAFAGEGVLEHIKPGEKRLLSYAVDQGVRITTNEDSETDRVTKVKVVRGMMTMTQQERAMKTYTIRNEDTSARSMVIEHPVQKEWKIISKDKPVETTANYYRFKVPVESKKTAKLTVEVAHTKENMVYIANVNPDMVDVYVKAKSIPASLEKALHSILAQKNVVADINARSNQKNNEIQSINTDQGRLRENMKALKGSAEEKTLIARYTKQLNDQEDQIEALRKDVTSLNQQRVQEQAKLDKMIMELNLEENL